MSHKGPSLYICYKIAIVKPPSVSYNACEYIIHSCECIYFWNLAAILSRYPTTDYEDFPLPDSSPLFCLPLGVCVEHWGNSGQFPLPTFSTFILTNSYGTKVCLLCVLYTPVKFCDEHVRCTDQL